MLKCYFIFIVIKFISKSFIKIPLIEKVLNNLSKYKRTKKSLLNSLLPNSRIINNKILRVSTPLAPIPMPKWLKNIVKMGV